MSDVIEQIRDIEELKEKLKTCKFDYDEPAGWANIIGLDSMDRILSVEDENQWAESNSRPSNHWTASG